ncbi:MAG: hypothetical protein J5769_02330 [Bacteroidales bacterium]|nr:hypothetical protein [Bacteroidales bacterium]
MRIKTIIAAALLSVIVCTAASAQAPAYREQGYKGSAGLSVTLIYPQIETTHGYMINTNHFIGGGASFFWLPGLLLAREFIDYQWFFKDAENTPMVGCQLGMMQVEDNFITIEPRFGWNWALKDNLGITASGGLFLGRSDKQLVFVPAIHACLEF